MKGLGEAFKIGIFELWYKKCVGFGVHSISALSPNKWEDKKVVKLLWTDYQTCERFDSGWSLVEGFVTIKKKGGPYKNSTKPKDDGKYVPLPLIGPLSIINHACIDHCNLKLGCASRKRYECTLMKAVRKGGQMLINYYADDEVASRDK
eukprot:5680282-Ditylum_brightwellii.AAC.1